MTGYRRFVAARRLGVADLAVALFVFAVLYALVRLGPELRAPITAAAPEAISLDPKLLPYYAGRSLFRMVAAFAASVLFSLGYGYAAARIRGAERVLIPLLDILQSVPVLGFLSVSLPALMGLFPGRIIGLELASIFAIFTSQVWNLTFAFYHSLNAIPVELRLAARVFRLNPLQRFTRLELPSAMISLVWNGMMSFGGGWFFLAASEAITVLNQRLMLPGLGSYLAVALERGNWQAVERAIVTMAAVILLLDQLFWRPVVAWAEKFKLDDTPSGVSPQSVVLTALRRSAMVEVVERWVGWLGGLAADAVNHWWARYDQSDTSAAAPRLAWLLRGLGAVLLVILGAWSARYGWMGLRLVGSLGAAELLRVAGLGTLTLLRVAAAVVLGALWTVPVGVTIGLNPRLAGPGQSLAQLAAAFPANMLFPFLGEMYLRFRVNFEVGSILLMMLGTQWYILFNVIAGASALPAELRDAASVFRLRGWVRWRRVILPAVFPALVTGCLTAAGGAWNASIVAEVIAWGSNRLTATGLGAYITHVTQVGDRAGIAWSITVMALMVVALNRLVWRRLFQIAETRFAVR